MNNKKQLIEKIIKDCNNFDSSGGKGFWISLFKIILEKYFPEDKEKEVVETEPIFEGYNDYSCGDCSVSISLGDKYCSRCGNKIKRRD